MAKSKITLHDSINFNYLNRTGICSQANANDSSYDKNIINLQLNKRTNM